MKQVITRMDENLHTKLRRRAALEHRSVNAVMIEAATAYLADNDRVELSTILEEVGLLDEVPKTPADDVDFDTVVEQTRGWGTSVSEALMEGRRSRW